MSDLDAGRLSVEVVGDTSGFSRDLQRKIDAQTKGVRARIQASIDEKGLRAEARAAARKAEAGLAVKARVDVDAVALRKSLGQALRQAARSEKPPTIAVRVVVDRKSLDAELRAISATRPSITIDADTTAAAAKIEALRAKARDRVNMPVGGSGGGVGSGAGSAAASASSAGAAAIGAAGQALSSLSLIPAIASGIILLAGALTNVAGGLFAITAAASPAVFALAAIPNILGAAVAGLGGLIIGLTSVLGVVKQLNQADKAGATANASRQAAQDRVARAKTSVTNAQVAANRAAVLAARQVSDAEDNLARAQGRAAAAQRDVNRAREDAKRRLDDLRDAERDSALSVEGAEIALERARERANEVNTSATSTDLDRREAALAVAQAERDLIEANEAKADVTEENNKAQKEGIEGSAEVVNAKAAEAEAAYEAAKAEQDLAEARADAAFAQQQAAQRVADAQRDLAEAQRDATAAQNGTSAAALAAQDAYNKLSDTQKSFVDFIRKDWKDAWSGIQTQVADQVLPGIQTGLQRLVDKAPEIGTALGAAGKVVSDTFADVLTNLTDIESTRQLGLLSESGNKVMRSLGRAVSGLVRPLLNIAEAAIPLAEDFADWIDRLVNDKFTKATGNIEDLRKKFLNGAAVAKRLGRIIKNIWDGIIGLGRAATPAGDSLLASFEKATEKFAAWAQDPDGSIGQWFTNAIPDTEALGSAVVEILTLLGRLGEVSDGALLGGLVRVLEFLVTTAEAIAKVPWGGEILTLFFTIAASGLVLGKVAAGFAGIAKSVGAISKGAGAVGTVLSKASDYVVGKGPGKGKEGPRQAGLATKVKAGAQKAGGAVKRGGAAVARGAATAATTVLSGAASAGSALATAGKGVAGFIANVARAGGQAAVAAGRFLLINGAMLAIRTGQLLAAAATGILAAAQTVLNIAMSPLVLTIGAIVLAVALFVAGLVWAYNNVGWFRDLVDTAFENIKGWIETAFNWVKDNWPLLLAILTGPFGLVIKFVRDNWDKITEKVRGVIDWVKTNWPALLALLTGPFGLAIKWVRDNWDRIVGFFGGLGERIGNAVSGIREAIVGPIRAARNLMQGFVNWWNNLVFQIPRFTIPLPFGATFDFGGGTIDPPNLPNLPAFAKGGIVPGGYSRDDNMLIKARSGEGVLVPEVVRALGGRRFIDAVNRAAGNDDMVRRIAASSASALGAVASAGAANRAAVGGLGRDTTVRGGVVIEAGAIQQTIHNPVPETASKTLNSRLRVLAAGGLFDGSN